MAEKDVVIKLLLDAKEFSAKIMAAGRELTQFAKKGDGFGNALHTAFNKVGKAAAIGVGAIATAATAAGVALVGATLKATEYGEAVDKMSKTTGMSAETVSRLGYAASQEHASMEALEKGTKKLSRTMVEARDGNSAAAETFSRLGISVVGADGQLRGMDSVMLDVADRFKGMTDETEKAALAQELFGKSGMEMIPFLNMGSEEIKRLGFEADQLGITLTQKSAAAFEAFGDNLAKMKASLKGLGVAVAEDALPAFDSLVVAGTEAFNKLRESGTLTVAVSGIADVIQEILPTVTDFFGRILKFFGDTNLFQRFGSIFGDALKVVVDVLGRVLDAAEPLIDPLMDIAELVGEAFATVAPIIGDMAEALATALKPALEGFATGLQAIMPFIETVVSLTAKWLEWMTPLLEIIGKIAGGALGLLGKAIDLVTKPLQWLGNAFGDTTAECEAANRALNKLIDTQARTGADANKLFTHYQNVTAELAGMTAGTEEYNAKLQEQQDTANQLVEVMPELQAGRDAEGNAILQNTDAIKGQIEQLAGLNTQKGGLLDKAREYTRAIADEKKGSDEYKQGLSQMTDLLTKHTDKTAAAAALAREFATTDMKPERFVELARQAGIPERELQKIAADAGAIKSNMSGITGDGLAALKNGADIGRQGLADLRLEYTNLGAQAGAAMTQLPQDIIKAMTDTNPTIRALGLSGLQGYLESLGQKSPEIAAAVQNLAQQGIIKNLSDASPAVRADAWAKMESVLQEVAGKDPAIQEAVRQLCINMGAQFGANPTHPVVTEPVKDGWTEENYARQVWSNLQDFFNNNKAHPVVGEPVTNPYPFKSHANAGAAGAYIAAKILRGMNEYMSDHRAIPVMATPEGMLANMATVGAAAAVPTSAAGAAAAVNVQLSTGDFNFPNVRKGDDASAVRDQLGRLIAQGLRLSRVT